MINESLNDPIRKRKENSSWQLPPEVDAVLRVSANLRPCKRKYGRIPYDQFLRHIEDDCCAQCHELLVQLDKELRMMAYLRDHKN
jgi:hypothetical protein